MSESPSTAASASAHTSGSVSPLQQAGNVVGGIGNVLAGAGGVVGSGISAATGAMEPDEAGFLAGVNIRRIRRGFQQAANPTYPLAISHITVKIKVRDGQTEVVRSAQNHFIIRNLSDKKVAYKLSNSGNIISLAAEVHCGFLMPDQQVEVQVGLRSPSNLAIPILESYTIRVDAAYAADANTDIVAFWATRQPYGHRTVTVATKSRR